MTDELMSLDDIAALYRCSRRHARDTLTKLPGFPKRVRGSSERIPLWLRTDVQAFMYGVAVPQPELREAVHT